MANLCTNTLDICGPIEKIEEFLKIAIQAENMDLSLGSFKSCPEELRKTDSRPPFSVSDEQEKIYKKNKERYGYEDWFDWSMANWGTKRDIVDAELVNTSPTTLCYRFESAWSPPLNWLEEVALMFPKLIFVLFYNEPMMAFEGKAFAYDETFINKSWNNEYGFLVPADNLAFSLRKESSRKCHICGKK